jgi:hypothetical protein
MATGSLNGRPSSLITRPVTKIGSGFCCGTAGGGCDEGGGDHSGGMLAGAVDGAVDGGEPIDPAPGCATGAAGA